MGDVGGLLVFWTVCPNRELMPCVAGVRMSLGELPGFWSERQGKRTCYRLRERMWGQGRRPHRLPLLFLLAEIVR